MSEDATTPRTGTGADLSRRMDRLEAKHDELANDVTSLKRIVDRIEVTQQHQVELTQLRFTALDTATAAVGQKLDAFIARMESLLTGETQTATTRDLMTDWKTWRASVESRLDTHEQADNKTRVWIGGATVVVGIVVLLAQVFGPVLLRMLTQ